MTLIIIPLSKMPLSIMPFSLMPLSTMALKTLSLTKLRKVEFILTFRTKCHMKSANMLNVVAPPCNFKLNV